MKKFPKIYQEIRKRWGKYLSSPLKVLSGVASKFIRYNEYIKINNNTIYYCYFSQKILNHIGDLFENNVKMRSWEDLKAKLGLDDKLGFWRQIIHTIPRAWKETFLECSKGINDLIIK